MSDQAPLPGTDDEQVINNIADIDADIDVMHDRYRELWVDIELADISIPQHLQSSFNRTYQQIDSLTKPLQIARLSKMVQQLEMILSKKKTGRKNSESASMDLESQTGASADSGAHSDVSKLSEHVRNIPGASASAASFPSIPTARPETDSELNEPCSSGKRTAAQAALSDRGENFTRAAVKNSVLGERLPVDDRRKRRSLSAVQQTQLQAFITFAINYFREKARDATTVTTRPWRHTNSEQLVSFYNESLTRTEKEQGMEFSMPLFRSNSLQLHILQTSGSVSEAMSILGEKLSASRINYSRVSLRRCIKAKPDIADVINWCRDYTIQNPDQKLNKKTIMEAMEEETKKRNTTVPNGCKRLRTLFSNGMITMNKLQRLRLLEGNEGSEPGSDANHECDDEDGETTTAAGRRDDGEDGGGGGGDGGESGDGGDGGGPSAGGADGGGGEADGGGGGGAADGARGLSGARAAGIPNDVSDASPRRRHLRRRRRLAKRRLPCQPRRRR